MPKASTVVPFCLKSNPMYRFILATIITCLVGAAAIYYQFTPPEVTSTSPVTFIISRGQGLDSIGRTLVEHRLVRSVAAFKLYATLTNNAKLIQAGDYRLPAGLSLIELVENLKHGQSDRTITFINGWRREQYAQTIVDEFSKQNPEYAFSPEEFLSLTKNLEGHLYPDTYAFAKGVTAKDIVDVLTYRFDTLTKDLSSSPDFKSALILASLLEREALTDAEKPLIAGVLKKRLDQGWPLQVDATVQYAIASGKCPLITCEWWPQSLTRADIDINSPYNTYKTPGLPPAPISNPSLSSIKAALDPQSSPYYFYLHDPEGNIHFAITLEEHNQNIREFLSE